MRRLRAMGLRGQLVLLVMLAIIPLLLLQGYEAYSRFGRRVQVELNANRDYAAATAVAFGNFVESIWDKELLIGTAFTLDGAGLSQSHMGELLRAEIPAHLSVGSFAWVTPDGRVAAASYPIGFGASMTDRPYFQRILAGEEKVLSDLHSSAPTNAPVVIIARGFRENGRLLGVVVAAVDVTKLGQILPGAEVHRAFALLDTHGKVVYHSEAPDLPMERRNAHSHDSSWGQKRGQAVSWTRMTSPVDGVERLGMTAPVPGTDWTAMSATPRSVVLREAVAESLRALAVTMTVALGALLGALLLSRRMLRPIQALQSAAQAISMGDLTARVRLQGSDELGRTALTFDRMAERLQELEADQERFFRLSTDLLCIIGFDGYIKQVNSAWQQALGYSLDDLTARPYLDMLVHPDDRAEVSREVREVQASGHPLHLEARILHRDGSYRWYSWNSTADPERKVRYVVGRDITGRKAEDAALERRARQQEALTALGQEAIAGAGLDSLLQSAAMLLREQLEADWGGVFHLLPDNLNLRILAWTGGDKNLIGRVLSGAPDPEEGRLAILDPEPTACEDFSADPRFNSSSLVQELGARGGLITVIPGRTRPFGVIGIACRQRRQFTADDIHFAKSVSTLVATVVERYELERYLAAGHSVARMLAESRTASEAIPQVLRLLCEELDWQVGAFWSWQSERQELQCSAIWHAPALDPAGFRAVGEVTVGQCCAHGKPLWIKDLAEELGLPDLAGALDGGLRGMFILPVRCSADGSGALQFFSREPRRPDEELLAVMEAVAIQLGQFIDRCRAEEEQREAVRRTEEARALLDTLLESSPVGIVFLDREQRFVRLNDALAELHGLPVEAHIGRTVQELLPDIGDAIQEVVTRVLQTGEPKLNWELQMHSRALPGEQRHLLEQIYPVRLNDGEVVGIGAVVADITDLKRAEEAVRRSEARLAGQKRILEIVAEGAPLGEVLEALSQFVEEHTHRPCQITLYDPMAPSAEGPEPEDGEHRTPILGQSGELLGTLTLVSQGKGIPDEGPFLKAAAHLLAIAILKNRAEEARQLKLRSLVEHMDEGVIAVDETGMILVANPATYRLLQLSGQLQSRCLTEAGLPKELAQSLLQVMKPESSEALRLRLRHAERELDTYVTPVITKDGRHHGAIIRLQDITREAQLRHLEESFVSNVSHELRGPLAALSATLEAMADEIIRPLDYPRYLKSMLLEMGRLRRLANDLLELSRLDAGVLPLKEETVDLKELLQSLEELWGLRCQGLGLSMAVDCPSLTALADYDRVEQVITTFLDNAIRHTPAGGEVRLQAEREGDWVRITITDTGVGIPSEHLPYVWQRFYMVDRARTRSPERGTGLGLPIARQLVEQMGGQVFVESQVNMGSRFSFTLPVA